MRYGQFCIQFAIILALAICGMDAWPQERSSVSLDGAWAFQMDPKNAGETERWFAPEAALPDTIQVPGAWEAQGFGNETDKLKHHFIGKGWYQRKIDIPVDWAGRSVFLCFGGVHRYASIWVNGQFLGEHIGYLSPFEYDVTKIAAPGTTATITVRVDSEQRWDIDTLLGCFDIIDYMDTYWGGIWGHVRLEAREPVYLEDLFVEPRVSPQGCRVSATVQGTPPQGARLRLEILDAAGQSIQTSESTAALTAGERAVLETEAPDAKLWTPDTPILYTARLSVMAGEEARDTLQTRFGFRTIVFDGPRILLNGQPIYLRGYGDDAIYPETMAAPSDEAVYRKKIAIAKEYGFNHVRHHSHMLPPEYYDVCDELGMLVSAELPIGYTQFYKKAQGPALALYATEWAAAIRRLRNHPSIFDWCMGNEIYDAVEISPELYRIAKELDPTRPTVDTDGVWPKDFSEGNKDRDTLDFYFMQFDVFNTPLDTPEQYRCPAPLKPVISHETGNFVTFPRLDQIDLFRDNFKPFWLLEARDKVEKMGLMAEVPRWAESTERLYTLLHKVNMEGIRKNPMISGYHWWLLQDYWTTSNGIIDTYSRIKPGVDRERILEFNNAVVLLQDGLAVNYRGGERLAATFLVSNFGPAELPASQLSLALLQGTIAIAEQTPSTPAAPCGALTELTKIDLALPQVDAPVQLTLKAKIQAGDKTFANEWTTWVYPNQPAAQGGVPLFANSELLPWLAGRGAQPLPAEQPYPSNAVYFTNTLTPEVLDAVLAGASAILFKPLGFISSAGTRFKTAWWLGSPGDNNAGTVVYDHPVTRAMAPEGWCDAAWYRLLENCEGYLLDELPAQPNVILRGVEVACVCRNKGMIFEASAGKGSLLVCGLNLDAVLPGGAADPAAQWLATQFIDYAGTFPHPNAAMPEAFLRERAVEAPNLDPPFVEGFSALLKNEGESAQWFTYRKERDRTELLRQTEKGRTLEWETAAVPESLPGERLTFVFAGGLGWLSQPANDGFALLIDGKNALNFDVTRSRSTWTDKSGQVVLSFVPRRMTQEDAAGMFYLGVPRDWVKPGTPCRLGVKSHGNGSQRWFALHPYQDVLQ